jgi:demethylmenaquinone methyltransferase / 2-methoxy-6-polyprenyl-1,4-benzoquinol methylase
MFGRIARRYDLMNTLMTLGMDRGWRKAAVRAAQPLSDGLALDVGTGTARLAAALADAMPAGRVIGIDLALPMLGAGQAWLWHDERAGHVVLVGADAVALPFTDARFDCLTSAFTMRNLPDLEAAFREQARVVKPGGRVVCLELAWPPSAPMRALFPLYFGRVVPLLGRVVARDRAAYSYLPASVREFPPPEALAVTMRQAGLANIRWRRLGFGTVTLHVGVVEGKEPIRRDKPVR